MKKERPNWAVVIQARMGSTRYPGKVLSDFCGKPMLEYQVSRLQSFGLEIPIVIATSTKQQDDEIAAFCKKSGLQCYRGSEDNVFSRFREVAAQFGFDEIVRLTGDNPLPSQTILRECIKSHREGFFDLTTTREITRDGKVKRYVPKGLSVDIIKSKSLLRIDIKSLNSFEEEHVIPVFFTNKFNLNIVKSFNFPDIDLSVDTIEDKGRVMHFVEINDGFRCNILNSIRENDE